MPLRSRPYEAVDGIALIPVWGLLKKRPHPLETFLNVSSYEHVRFSLEHALQAQDIEGILLDIESPGGEGRGVFALAEFIYNSRPLKPIVARIEDQALSAAYLLASAASQIYAGPLARVGSLGVLAQHVDQSEKDRKEGYQVTTLYKGARKNDGNPHEPLTQEARTLWEKELEVLYRAFLETVALYREVPFETLSQTEAGIFYGREALKLGLVDHLLETQGVQDLFKKPVRGGAFPSFTKDQETRMKQTSLSHAGSLPNVPPLETQEGALESVQKTEISPKEPQAPPPEPPSALPERREEAQPVYPHALEVARLCQLAGRPDRILECIEQHLTPAETQKTLLKSLAQEPSIDGSFSQRPSESPLIKEAHKRVQKL